MLLQQASPGPSCTASPKLARVQAPSPNPSSRLTGSPNLSDGASSSNSSRFGIPGSPRLGAGGSPMLGIGSPRGTLARSAAAEEVALERLQTELKEGWTVHTGRDGRLYYCK